MLASTTAAIYCLLKRPQMGEKHGVRKSERDDEGKEKTKHVKRRNKTAVNHGKIRVCFGWKKLIYLGKDSLFSYVHLEDVWYESVGYFPTILIPCFSILILTLGFITKDSVNQQGE